MTNKLLLKQLKRLDLTTEQLPASHKEWQLLLERVSETYDLAEQDRYLLERSLEISSREMSERLQQNKELTSQLIQSSKQASLGVMASGIAHELNNPLAIMRGKIELLKRNDPAQGNIQEFCIKMDALIERMAGTINHLLKISRKKTSFSSQRTSISDCVKEIQETYHIMLTGGDIELVFTNHATDDLVLCDPSEMFTILQNLLTNSVDAFASNKIRPGQIEINLREEGPHLVLQFKDNAGGIPEHVLANIFDPFFTTKEVGKGTGLGLSLLNNVVSSHNGTVQVKSSQGCTSFEIGLSKALPKPSAHLPQNLNPAHPIKQKIETGKPKLLMVDDEPQLLEIMTEVFANHFEITARSSATLATEDLRREAFDLLITDFNMPQMSGPELARLAHQQNPATKIVIISGHMPSEVYLSLKGMPEVLTLQKPFQSLKTLKEDVLGLMAKHPSLSRTTK